MAGWSAVLLKKWIDRIRLTIGAGAGRFLAAKLAARHNYQYTDFEQMTGLNEIQQPRVADCATAVSVAQLMRLAE